MNFILTGCAGAGKTTSLNHLAKLGYTCYEEISRKIIKKQLVQQTTAVPWKDTVQFCHLDRGLPDIIAYLKAVNHPVPKTYYDALEKTHYATTAFLFPPNETIYIKDNERQETFEEALLFFHSTKVTYKSLGFNLETVPLMSIDLRTRYILEHLESQKRLII